MTNTASQQATVDRIKSKKKRPVVRGPQRSLKLERTPRLRYIEAPAKTTGNPFFAVRVPRDVLVAFKRKAGKAAASMVREFMSKVSGVPLDDEGEE